MEEWSERGRRLIYSKCHSNRLLRRERYSGKSLRDGQEKVMFVEFLNNLFYEILYIIGDILYIFAFLLVNKFWNLPYLFWIVIISMVLLWFYLLLPERIDVILYDMYQKLVAWDRSLLSFGFSDTSNLPFWKKLVSQFFAVMLKGMISAIRIGLALWIGIGTAFLLPSALFLLMKYLGCLSFPEFNDLSGLLIIVSLYLIISGIYFLICFNSTIMAFSDGSEFQKQYKSFLFYQFAAINSLLLINFVYGISSGTYLSNLSAKIILIIFYIVFRQENPRRNPLFSNASFIISFIILFIGLTRTGILFGILPLYFLGSFLALLIPEIARHFHKPGYQGMNKAEPV
jgi:hypothetical protein